MSRVSPFVIALTLGSVLASAAAAAPSPSRDVVMLPFTIAAARDAEYSVKCLFPTYKVEGGRINTINILHKGPVKDTMPDKSRCTLRKIGGPGAVTLTVFKGKPYVATVSRPGEEAKLFLW